jgi:hypothetical protein
VRCIPCMSDTLGNKNKFSALSVLAASAGATACFLHVQLGRYGKSETSVASLGPIPTSPSSLVSPHSENQQQTPGAAGAKLPVTIRPCHCQPPLQHLASTTYINRGELLDRHNAVVVDPVNPLRRFSTKQATTSAKPWRPSRTSSSPAPGSPGSRRHSGYTGTMYKL